MKTIFICCFVMLVALMAASPAVAEGGCNRDQRDMDIREEDPGWTKNYIVFANALSWKEAKDLCYRNCQALATVTSKTEWVKLNKILENGTTGAELWLGGKCVNNYECKWQNTGAWMGHDFWQDKEPNVFPTNKPAHKCVYFQQRQKGFTDKTNFGLDECRLAKSFACQYFTEDSTEEDIHTSPNDGRKS